MTEGRKALAVRLLQAAIDRLEHDDFHAARVLVRESTEHVDALFVEGGTQKKEQKPAKRFAGAALQLATAAHAGQLDKSDEPFIHHPARVGASFDDDTRQTIGFLHDIVEDTDVMEELLRGIFPAVIVDAVIALTRKEDEPYPNFIRRVRMNELARQVKIADIRDNLRPGAGSLGKRYTTALGVLLEGGAS
jgi:hypothetical protein